MPELADNVVIEFSERLRSALGRTRVDVRRVRLNPILVRTSEKILEEVLCHELAHIAVYERFGSSVKPHGPEWAIFVRQAGYEPRLRISVAGSSTLISDRRFEHLCPVCQTTRCAKRPMRRWRCASCVDAGLEGKLIIRRQVKE